MTTIDARFAEFLKSVGPIAEFKPCAYYLMNEVKVMRKDCSYTARRITDWADIFIENHRPWYWIGKGYVGFSIYCPPKLGLRGEMPVTVALDRVAQVTSPEEAFGKYQSLVYRLAKNLKVLMTA